MSTAKGEDDWKLSWAAAIVSDPYSSKNVELRLQDLLDGKAVLGVTGFDKKNAKIILECFVQNVDWTFKPSVFDDIWNSVFNIAKRLRCTKRIRDATYFWTEAFLLNEAWDAYPEEESDKEHPDSSRD